MGAQGRTLTPVALQDTYKGMASLARLGDAPYSLAARAAGAPFSNYGRNDVGCLPPRVAYHGDIVLTKPNTLLENLEVWGTITMAATNCLVRNVRALGSDDPGFQGAAIYAAPGKASGSAIMDTTVVPHVPSGGQDGIQVTSVTVSRVLVEGMSDGVKFVGDYNSLLDSVVRDLVYYPDDPSHVDGTHNDALQFEGGSYTRVVGNDLSGGHNAAIMVTQNYAKVNDLLISRNRLSDGYITLNTSEKGRGAYTALKITDNRFGRPRNTGRVDAVITAATRAAMVFTGNVREDGTALIIQNAGS